MSTEWKFREIIGHVGQSLNGKWKCGFYVGEEAKHKTKCKDGGNNDI